MIFLYTYIICIYIYICFVLFSLSQINRDREKDIERSVRSIERLQLQMQEIRNNMQLSGRKFEDQRSLLTSEKASIQQQVVELRDTVYSLVSLYKNVYVCCCCVMCFC
jgi:hypothetical protein